MLPIVGWPRILDEFDPVRHFIHFASQPDQLKRSDDLPDGPLLLVAINDAGMLIARRGQDEKVVVLGEDNPIFRECIGNLRYVIGPK